MVAVAHLKAKESLAAYYVKSRIEWNFRGASDALSKTNKDEWLIIMWGLLTLGLFIPGVRDWVLPGWLALKEISDDAPKIFLYGWGAIFAATFGLRHAMNFLYPNRAATLVQALGNTPDDVPMDAARQAQASVDASSGMVDFNRQPPSRAED